MLKPRPLIKFRRSLRERFDAVCHRLWRIDQIAAAKRRWSSRRLLRTARVLALFFIVAAGFDAVSTNVALVAGHAEGNPLVSVIQTQLGDWWVVPRILFQLLFAFLILWCPSRKMISVARVVIVGYLAIFINNSYFAGWLA